MAAAASSSDDPLTVLQILWRAFLLPFAVAPSLLLPLLLLTFLSTSLLFLSAYSISPSLLDLLSRLYPLLRSDQPPSPPFLDLRRALLADLRAIARVAAPSALLFFLVSLLLTLAALYALAITYSSPSGVSPSQLLRRIARRWYQTLITRLYVLLLTLGLALLTSLTVVSFALALDASAPATVEGSSTVAGAVVVAVALLYLYLSTRWWISLVVTAVEETWGIGALSWSVELFIGNKKRGTALTLLLKSVQLGILAALGMALAAASAGPPGPPPPPPEKQMQLWAAAAAATALWEIYSMAAYAVFYYECRKSHGLELDRIKYEALI
ncbi:hypothetical protein ZIOFF_012068 [Zingiber officinale]|uniref:Uncharacterized protein n=1 Tax=Zingiber officinale TaxID=94328 RepID=A0A8J5HRS6_ZINOF|nr:hypothetical protein ZIOFF_012068 [Zingiber officinale]